MKFTTILYFLFFLFSCKNTEHLFKNEEIFFTYNEKNETITLFVNDTKEIIKDKIFYLIFDWSDDYVRDSVGTAWKFHDKIIFSGSLNNSHKILFFYNINNKILSYEELIDLFIIDEKIGIVFIKSNLPKYIKNGEKQLFINDKKVLEFDNVKIEKLLVEQDKLILELSDNKKIILDNKFLEKFLKVN